MSELTSGPPAASVVYEKSAKGTEEIQSRKHNLAQRLRTVLIIVDGKKSRQAILNQFGAVGPQLDELAQQGFIAAKAAASGIAALAPEQLQRNIELAKNFMTNTVKDALGLTPPALTFADAVEACRGLEDLQKKFDPYLSLITGASGKKTADAYRQELEKILFPK
jgi:hypothetical protein